MHARAVAALRCPVDGAALRLEQRTLRCHGGHRFDLARQGYVNLLTGRDPGTGDDAGMVRARETFLATGRFDPVTAALGDTVEEALSGGPPRPPADGVVVDLGAGTGHHLAAILDRLPERVAIAVDLSKHAARRAARRHPRVAAVVADVWRPLPLATGTAAAVTCVFAPRNAPEIARVLHPAGILVVVTPTAAHLAELVGTIGPVSVDPRKPERIAAAMHGHLEPVAPPRRVEVRWRLAPHEVRAVIAMGPSADHLDAAELDARVAELPDPVAVTASVELRTFRPLPPTDADVGGRRSGGPGRDEDAGT